MSSKVNMQQMWYVQKNIRDYTKTSENKYCLYYSIYGHVT